jgi:ADP-heptose:LPS heptosyltransferase/glycosyltransferase involved in cell wall biosynthesis/SAM-dependent methyltransferase
MPGSENVPVCCIMPTAGRPQFVPRAIEYFLRQDYPAKELIIVDDGAESVEALVPRHEAIRYVRLNSRATVGEKRNLACRETTAPLIVHWDDDDWYAPWRLRYQAESLLASQSAICGLDRLYYLDPDRDLAWEYVYPTGAKAWAGGSTLCYRREYWRRHPFPSIDIGEDARFVWQARPGELLALADNRFYVGLVHASNVSPKRTNESNWHPQPATRVRDLLGADQQRYAKRCRPAESTAPAALVAASRGLGDIIRATPLARALHSLGYAVDFLVEADFAGTAALLEGAPEIRRVITRVEDCRASRYDLAAFTYWSAHRQNEIPARRKLAFDRAAWLRGGDSAQVEKLAREAGFAGTIPAPFVVPSDRRFNLPPGTIALHPGCKPDWPWKKWHGFDELAAKLPAVAIIGTAADLDNSRTYFKRDFKWPGHVFDFTGKLDLRDTAALLRQCAALVSNDSGLMHLGVALGIPVHGIFGITSPAREAIPAPNMHPLTAGLACESACRRERWGRRDCEQHLACLKTLTADDVLARIAPQPQKQPQTVKRMSIPRLAYYGHVFDATGYGNAARAYIHAFHEAGIDLAVTDLAGHAPQVRDPLVQSLLRPAGDAAFHLFHGIPAYWARRAFAHPNAIGMTVWETDTMPSQWRSALSHVVDVWLPCRHNAEAFRNGIRTPVFELPHPVLPRPLNAEPPEGNSLLGTDPADFVFYSILEWQDRKSPAETIACFLQAFPDACRAVFVLKTGPAAAPAAHRALEEARRRNPSAARIIIRAEAWSEEQIEALHRRGDCYISLHRGEGWGYPLFEAAVRGKPVIATAHSGPLDYLSSDAHFLIPWQPAPVLQRYAFYNPRMRWAEPYWPQAVAAMRAAFANPHAARDRSRTAAGELKKRYSPASIGAAARARLEELADRTQPKPVAISAPAGLLPPVPVPPAWYDEDYFERGVKSNWTAGYNWAVFSGLFRETAQWLAAAFPGASFLDAGCAKGFLVRALREINADASGFDFSPWAIEHADPAARPHLEQAAVEDFHFAREFDVTLAFELLAHLTEEQALRFLERARGVTRTALLATIPSAAAPGDRDRSHITLRPREWWDALFRRAGWRQDALHRAFEIHCARHPLPARMGWSLYLYSPGEV